MTETIRLKPDVEWRRVGGEVVVLDVGSSAYMAVNDTGTILWPLVVEGATESRLVDELATHFHVEPEQAASDVKAFVDQLRSLSLVDIDGSESP